MVSRDPFNFTTSPAIAPIPCTQCGNNMQCIRREPVADAERQTFLCEACGHSSVRTLGTQESDYDVQRWAERSAGISRRVG